MNFSDFKEILPNDTAVQSFIKDKYGDDIKVKYSNVGFVIIPNNSEQVIKYYIPDSYIAFHFKENNQYNLYQKELDNYRLFKNHNILIPNVIGSGEELIEDYVFKYTKFENIRTNSKKFDSFIDVDMDKLVNLITNIHNIKTGYVHGNIHPNVFFINNNGDIGIYNLSSYYLGSIEEDISKICYGYNLDTLLIKDFLSKYGFNNIKSNLLLSKVYELTKLYTYNKNDFLKLAHLIKNL